MDTVGHPFLYGTTFSFLQHFGLKSLDDLPPLEPTQTPTLVEPDTPAPVEPMPTSQTEVTTDENVTHNLQTVERFIGERFTAD
jgi:segregation and condensation protein B